ncbi:hypothetical protein J1605_012906 [Eschrichtius robustus]|uniref:RNA-binding protein 38 n=6 Tax=Cetacea TaxID=9721 RepID=A0AB34GKP9_ESCRO|nr:hypothetical protein J1605_012906 [Eschrichtius robustus]
MLLQPAPCAPSAGFPRPPAALGAMHGSQKDTTFTKIFVGGLPYHTTDASLRKYFEGFGDIEEAVVITDRQTGKSRGYGFVTMADRAAAERACKDPNPNIDGRKANVNLAYLGAKPRSLQTGFAIGVQQLHPTLIQRTYGAGAHRSEGASYPGTADPTVCPTDGGSRSLPTGPMFAKLQQHVHTPFGLEFQGPYTLCVKGPGAQIETRCPCCDQATLASGAVLGLLSKDELFAGPSGPGGRGPRYRGLVRKPPVEGRGLTTRRLMWASHSASRFCFECVGGVPVCLPGVGPLGPPHLPRHPQMLLLRPQDLCLQGSRGGSVGLCSTLSLQMGKRGQRGPTDLDRHGQEPDSGSRPSALVSIGPSQLGGSWLWAAHPGRVGPGGDLGRHPFSSGCSA